MPIAAIDIGGTKIAACLVDSGAMLERRQIATPRSGGDEGLFDAVADVLRGWTLSSVATACTGWIDDGWLRSVNISNLTSDLSPSVPVRDEIARRTGVPVFVMNDAQAAAWGEYRIGAGQGARSMVFLTISTGVGAGIVVDGQLRTGPSAFAGHIGHTVIDPAGPQCGCGRKGCLEALASGRALEAAAGLCFGASMSCRELFSAAETSSMARSLIERSALAVAETLGNLRAVFDLDRAVIGGSVGLADGYLQAITRHMGRLPALFRVPVVEASLGPDAALRGVLDRGQDV